jgi:hypothetical protein
LKWGKKALENLTAALLLRDVLDLWTYAILIVSWRAVRRSLSLVMWAVLAEEIARVLLTAGLIDCR